MTSRLRSLSLAVAGAITGPIVLLVAVMIIGEVFPFNEATGSAAFALLFYLVPAACIVGAMIGWGLSQPTPLDRAPQTVGRRLPPTRGRTVAAGFVGAVLGAVAIDVIAAVWKAASGGMGDGRVYLVLVLCGTPAGIILGAIAGARAAARATNAAS